MVGVSMMVMGQSAVEINNRSIEPYMNRIVERERLRNQGLEVKEKWKELGSLFLALFLFCVPSPAIVPPEFVADDRLSGLSAPRYSVASRDGHTLTECTFA
jgi:hypothetical protein